MDELTALREYRREIAELPELAITGHLERAKARFTTRRENPHDARTKQARIPALRVLAPIAAAAVVAVIAVSVLVPRHSDSAAAAVLHRAADATVAAAPPALAPGQYLRVIATESSLAYVGAPSGTDDYTGAYVSPSVTATWIPKDQKSTWVREQYVERATTFYDETAAAAASAAEQAAADYASEPHQGDPDSITRAKGGKFSNGELGGDPDGEITPADLPSLPRDPQKLLDRLAQVPDAGVARSERVLTAASDLLATGLVPAELQSAIYDALALLPDLVVTRHQAALDGRTGTALGVKSKPGVDRTEIIVDDTTGSYIGRRTIQGAAVGPVPAGTVSSSTAVSIAVTSDAP